MDEENIKKQEEQKEQEPKELGDVLFGWKRKFDNFWYHYKVIFVIGVLIFAFLIFCIAQCALRIKGDVDIAYIGGLEIGAEAHEDLQDALNALLGEDFNGDGKIYAEFTQFSYMTSVQIENARARGQAVDIQSTMTVQTQMNLMLAEGNIVLYFIDYDVYKELYSRSGLFMPLEDALGYIPDSANDGYSIKLGALPCREYYSGIYIFPANTVIAVRDMQIAEEDDKTMQERYRRSLAMFKNLVEFTYGADTDDTDDTEDNEG